MNSAIHATSTTPTAAAFDLVSRALPALIALLADEVAKRLQAAPIEYDSRDNLPPGMSARTFRAQCSRIDGARHEGRIWRCSRDVYHASFPAHTPQQAADDGAEDAYELAARGRR